jgi:hypothetical protein
VSQLSEFASILNKEADELAEYARNLARANGGDETPQSEHYYLKSSILSEVAKAASKAAEAG